MIRLLSLRKTTHGTPTATTPPKNVTELYKADGTIATAYHYTPYGTASTNPSNGEANITAPNSPSSTTTTATASPQMFQENIVNIAV